MKFKLLGLLFLCISGYFLFNTFQTKPSDSNQLKKITVYTYSSFASSWGAGEEIKKLFKAKTNIEVEFVDVGAAGAILRRIEIEGDKTPCDVIMGLDQFSLEQAKKSFSFLDLKVNKENLYPEIATFFNPASFVLFDWSPMGFVYRKSELSTLPPNLNALTQASYKKSVVLYDPQISAPGFIFFRYVLDKLGEEEALTYFEKLKSSVYTVAPSWSTGYGLFTKKNAKLAYSYLVSPIYHHTEEGNFDYAAFSMEGDSPLHLEYAGVLESSKNKEGAQKFIQFILEPEVQRIIMQKNYMLPVIANVAKGTAFEKLPPFTVYNFIQKFSREEVIAIWKKIKW